MDVTKEAYINDQLSIVTQLWFGRAGAVCIVLYWFCSIMDHYIAPKEIFWSLQVNRLLVTVGFIFFLVINRITRNRTIQYFMCIIGPAVAAISLTIMVVQLGGHSSNYYAGLNLVFIMGLLFLPVPWLIGLFNASMVFVLYIGAIMTFDTVTNQGLYIANLTFMVCTATITLAANYYRNKGLKHELGLQYDLSREKTKFAALAEQRTLDFQRSELWQKEVFENTTDTILVMDKDGVITNANHKAEILSGVEHHELIGMRVHDLSSISADIINKSLEEVIAGKQPLVELQHRRKDGTILDLEVSMKALNVAGITYVQAYIRDITEKKATREMLMESQKLDSIGTLAGGIAHDFRNVITAVLAYIEGVKTGKMTEDKLQRRSSLLEESLKSASTLISQLLSFARKTDIKLEPVDLNDVVRNSVKLVEMIFKKRIFVDVVLDENLPLIQGDRNQMQNIVINLMTNARDAIGSKESGVIRLRTYSILGTSDKVILEVSDNGCGMTQEVREKVFVPYYTTKHHTGGAGLGLSMVYGVVTGVGGNVFIETEVGLGTTFKLVFNAATEPATVNIDSTTTADTTSLKGSGRILLVDDAEALLIFTKDMLEENGYTVVAETSPEMAIEIFRRDPESFDLVISDVVMEKIDGVELAGMVRKVKPHAAVLLVSAYTKLNEREIDTGDYEFLSKPFTGIDLLTKVKGMLNPVEMLNTM